MSDRYVWRRCLAGAFCLLLLTSTGCGRNDRTPADSSAVSSDQVESTDSMDSTTTTTTTTTKPTVKQTKPSTSKQVADTTATTTSSSRKTVATTEDAIPTRELFFPAARGGKIGTQPASRLKEVTVEFKSVMRLVRLSLPDTVTVKLVEEDDLTYAALYRSGVRIGRLVPDETPADQVNSAIIDTDIYNSHTVQTRRYTIGNKTAITYMSSVYTEDKSHFCMVEMDANSIRQADFAACVSNLYSAMLLTRSNRLNLKDKPSLKIAIAGNSFVGTSQIGQQLEAMLNKNGKTAQVDAYCYANYRIVKFTGNADFMRTIREGDYDVLFQCGVYGADDVMLLPLIELACDTAGTQLVLLPAHNEADDNIKLAYQTTAAKMAYWREVLEKLIAAGVSESELAMNDSVRHSMPLAGYAGAVMIYGMLYETAPNTAQLALHYSPTSLSIAQQVEDTAMAYIRSYF